MSKRPLHSTVTWQFSADNSELDPTSRDATAQPHCSSNRRASAGNVFRPARNAPLLGEKRRRLLLLAHYHNKNVSSSDHSSEDMSEIARNSGEISKQSSFTDVHMHNEENRPMISLSPNKFCLDRQKLCGNVDDAGNDELNEVEQLSTQKSVLKNGLIDCQPSTSTLMTRNNSVDSLKETSENCIQMPSKPIESIAAELTNAELKSFSDVNVTIRTKLKRPLIGIVDDEKIADDGTTRTISSNLTKSPHFEFAPPAKRRHFPSTATIKLASSSLPLLLFSSCPISTASSGSPLSAATSKYSFSSTRNKSTSSSSVQFSRSSSVSSPMPANYPSMPLENPGRIMDEKSLNARLSLEQPVPSTSSFLPLENSFDSSMASVSSNSNLPLSQGLDLLMPLKPSSMASTVSVSNVSNVIVRQRAASTASLLNSSHSWKSGSSRREFKSATFDETSMASISKSSDNNRGELPKMGGRTSRKPPKKKVNFGGLRVFYFGRTQGFDTVPMTGSVALGMENYHHTTKDYSFFEFSKSNRRDNSEKCASWRRTAASEIRSRSSSRAGASPKVSTIAATTVENSAVAPLNNNFQEIVENESPLSEKAVVVTTFLAESLLNELISSSSQDGGLNLTNAPLEESRIQTDCEWNEARNSKITQGNFQTSPQDELFEQSSSSSGFSSDEDVGDEFAHLECQFQPIRSRIRKMILKTSGIPIDKSNRDEYKQIVQSRAACGCNCAGGVCEAETCACAKIGVGCQVDRASFPCGCASEAQCKNPEGRIEFDPLKVHTHFLQTIMRLKVIQKRGLENSSMSVSPQHIKFDESDATKMVTSSSKSKSVEDSSNCETIASDLSISYRICEESNKQCAMGDGE